MEGARPPGPAARAVASETAGGVRRGQNRERGATGAGRGRRARGRAQRSLHRSALYITLHGADEARAAGRAKRGRLDRRGHLQNLKRLAAIGRR